MTTMTIRKLFLVFVAATVSIRESIPYQGMGKGQLTGIQMESSALRDKDKLKFIWKADDPNTFAFLRMCGPYGAYEVQPVSYCSKGIIFKKPFMPHCICPFGVWILKEKLCDTAAYIIVGDARRDICYTVDFKIRSVLFLGDPDDVKGSKTYVSSRTMSFFHEIPRNGSWTIKLTLDHPVVVAIFPTGAIETDEGSCFPLKETNKYKSPVHIWSADIGPARYRWVKNCSDEFNFSYDDLVGPYNVYIRSNSLPSTIPRLNCAKDYPEKCFNVLSTTMRPINPIHISTGLTTRETTPSSKHSKTDQKSYQDMDYADRKEELEKHPVEKINGDEPSSDGRLLEYIDEDMEESKALNLKFIWKDGSFNTDVVRLVPGRNRSFVEPNNFLKELDSRPVIKKVVSKVQNEAPLKLTTTESPVVISYTGKDTSEVKEWDNIRDLCNSSSVEKLPTCNVPKYHVGINHNNDNAFTKLAFIKLQELAMGNSAIGDLPYMDYLKQIMYVFEKACPNTLVSSNTYIKFLNVFKSIPEGGDEKFNTISAAIHESNLEILNDCLQDTIPFQFRFLNTCPMKVTCGTVEVSPNDYEEDELEINPIIPKAIAFNEALNYTIETIWKQVLFAKHHCGKYFVMRDKISDMDKLYSFLDNIFSEPTVINKWYRNNVLNSSYLEAIFSIDYFEDFGSIIDSCLGLGKHFSEMSEYYEYIPKVWQSWSHRPINVHNSRVHKHLDLQFKGTNTHTPYLSTNVTKISATTSKSTNTGNGNKTRETVAQSHNNNTKLISTTTRPSTVITLNLSQDGDHDTNLNENIPENIVDKNGKTNQGREPSLTTELYLNSLPPSEESSKTDGFNNTKPVETAINKESEVSELPSITIPPQENTIISDTNDDTLGNTSDSKSNENLENMTTRKETLNKDDIPSSKAPEEGTLSKEDVPSTITLGEGVLSEQDITSTKALREERFKKEIPSTKLTLITNPYLIITSVIDNKGENIRNDENGEKVAKPEENELSKDGELSSREFQTISNKFQFTTVHHNASETDPSGTIRISDENNESTPEDLPEEFSQDGRLSGDEFRFNPNEKSMAETRTSKSENIPTKSPRMVETKEIIPTTNPQIIESTTAINDSEIKSKNNFSRKPAKELKVFPINPNSMVKLQFPKTGGICNLSTTSSTPPDCSSEHTENSSLNSEEEQYYFLLSSIGEVKSDAHPHFNKYMEKVKSIFVTACPSKFISGDSILKLQHAFQSFLPENIEAHSKITEERHQSNLKTLNDCLEDTPSFKFHFLQNCPVRVVCGTVNESKGSSTPIDTAVPKDIAFNSPSYDIAVEAMWKLILVLEYQCGKHFVRNNQINEMNELYSFLEKPFALPSMLNKWYQPANLTESSLANLFSIESLEAFAEVTDSCLGMVKHFSEKNEFQPSSLQEWVRRPANKRNRKRRETPPAIVWDGNSYCIESYSDPLDLLETTEIETCCITE